MLLLSVFKSWGRIFNTIKTMASSCYWFPVSIGTARCYRCDWTDLFSSVFVPIDHDYRLGWLPVGGRGHLFSAGAVDISTTRPSNSSVVWAWTFRFAFLVRARRIVSKREACEQQELSILCPQLLPIFESVRTTKERFSDYLFISYFLLCVSYALKETVHLPQHVILSEIAVL